MHFIHSLLFSLALAGGGDEAESRLAVYDLSAARPPQPGPNGALLLAPLLGRGGIESEEREPWPSSDELAELIRGLATDDFEYEGCSMEIEDGDRMVLRAPAELHDLVRDASAFLEGVVGAGMELEIDAIAPPSGRDSAPVLMDASEAAALVASASARRGSWKLRLVSGRLSGLDLTRTIAYVADYDVEIAQAAATYDPISDVARVGPRFVAEAAPAAGGVWLALIARDARELAEPELVDDPLAYSTGLLSSRDVLETSAGGSELPSGRTTAAGPRYWQSLSLENRSFALSTFLPDGKALVVQTSLGSRGAASATWIVLRASGARLAPSLRFPAQAGDARSAEILLHDTSAISPPRCQFDTRPGNWEGVPNRQTVHYDLELVTLAARVASGERDPVHERLVEAVQPALDNGPRHRHQSLGPWAAFTRARVRADAETESGPWADALSAAHAALAPAPRLLQASVTVRRGASVLARCVLPIRAGEFSGAALGIERIEHGDYDVEVATGASVSDPVLGLGFEGLVVALRPSFSSGGAIALDVGAWGQQRRGDAREFGAGTPMIGRIQQSTYDQLVLNQRVVLEKSAGPRRALLGDASGNGLALDVEVVELN